MPSADLSGHLRQGKRSGRLSSWAPRADLAPMQKLFGIAVIVGLMGWAYTRTGRYSFIADGVRKFIRKNPHLFRRLDEISKDR